MKSFENVDQMEMMELSYQEEREIYGGNETFRFNDSHGYTWNYTYNDAGVLVDVWVGQSMCVS